MGAYQQSSGLPQYDWLPLLHVRVKTEVTQRIIYGVLQISAFLFHKPFESIDVIDENNGNTLKYLLIFTFFALSFLFNLFCL